MKWLIILKHRLSKCLRKSSYRSLRRIKGKVFPYCFSSLEQKDKAAFAESIFKRRNIPWKEIKNLPRHGLGIEKISKSSIKTALPKNITEDFNYFLAFRFSGKKPMVGYRVHEIFYVLWFDHDFTLYEH